MTQKRAIYYFPLFLVAYFAVAMTRWVIEEEDLYPVASWGMFQYVLPFYDEYDVEVLATETGPLAERVSLREPSNPLGHRLDGEGVMAVCALFRMHRSKRPTEELRAQFQRTIERSYLEPGWTYQLVWRRHFTRRTHRRAEWRGDKALGPYVATAPSGGGRESFDFARAHWLSRASRDPYKRTVKRRASRR